MRSLIKKENKKGQFASILLAVITIFIIAIILLFFNHLNKQVYDSLDEYLEDSEYDNTESHQITEKLQEIEGSRIWDYVFLAAFMGIMIQMIVLSFASKTNVAFFWIFVLLGIIILVVGTILSNIWQEIAINPEFSETIARFTITNTILGSYYPTIITGIFFLGLIIIFGKFPGLGEE